MTRLAEWLTIQVDADEAAARAAWPGPWELRTETGGFGPVAWVMMPIPQHEGAGTGLTSYVPLGSQDAATAGHIALHDPVRALAEVAFKREILAAFNDQPGYYLHGDVAEGRDDDERRADEQVKVMLEDLLEDMAEVYQGRPGYAEAIL